MPMLKNTAGSSVEGGGGGEDKLEPESETEDTERKLFKSLSQEFEFRKQQKPLPIDNSENLCSDRPPTFTTHTM